MVSFILLLKSLAPDAGTQTEWHSQPGFSLRAILFINRQRFFRVRLI